MAIPKHKAGHSPALEAVRASYDRTPYPGQAQSLTHPDHLAAVALLHGLEPASPDHCRVLELGCGDAGNLIPMAFRLPDSRFVGVDLSPRQIQDGRALARSLGLTNLDLRAVSLTEVDESYGQFDYILVHGVFSWVTEEVRERILAICKANLAPQGLAYVSYNTLPGWRARGMVRDMMLYHVRGIQEPEERVERALALLDFLVTAQEDRQDAHSLALQEVQQHLRDYQGLTAYLSHEYLETDNQPFYFHEFMALAGAAGLQYLAEADTAFAEVDTLPPAVREPVEAFAPDRVGREQYLDFIRNRAFRRSLLCHQERQPERGADSARLERLSVGAALRCEEAEPDLVSPEPLRFVNPEGRDFSSTHPLAKTLLWLLSRTWPGNVPFVALLAAAREHLPVNDVDPAVAVDILASSFWAGVVDLRARSLGCASQPGSQPRASALARRQLTMGDFVTSLRHHTLHLADPLDRVLLAHFDGDHDRAALLAVLEREAEEGRLQLSLEGRPISDPVVLSAVLGQLLEEKIQHLAEQALLEQD